MAVFSVLYTIISVLLAIYGLNSLYLVLAYYRTNKPRQTPPPPAEWPKVTIQLPIYNEMYIVDRLVTTVSAMDYPHDKLEIQVLDDSNDETTCIVAGLVKKLQSEGLDIVHLHRTHQAGFKAGALNEGLQVAKGDYIAIFDADFIPPKDFLRRTIPWFTSPEIGCVQGRWAHANRNFSLTTRVQGLALDVSDGVLQAARYRNGLLFQFRGSAGVISRACLKDSGGWDTDTLTEDLDFSLKAQLRGWRFVHLPDLNVPAELPVLMTSLLKQQERWAKGGMQTMRKRLLPILRSSLSLKAKIQGIFFLTGYLVYPLILALMILALPANLSPWRFHSSSWFFSLAAAGGPALYLTARTINGPNLWGRLSLIPAMVLLGIGLLVTNTKAVILGLFSHETGVFVRTPKFGLNRPGDSWQGNLYAAGYDPIMWAEALLIGYTLLSAYLVRGRNIAIALWCVINAMGFIFVMAITVVERIYLNSKMKVSKKTIRAAKENS